MKDATLLVLFGSALGVLCAWLLFAWLEEGTHNTAPSYSTVCEHGRTDFDLVANTLAQSTGSCTTPR